MPNHQKGPDQEQPLISSAEDHVAKLQAMPAEHEAFMEEVELEPYYNTLLINIERADGGEDKIGMHLTSSKPEVISINVDARIPVQFAPTTYILVSRRYTPQTTESS